jgi:hypothetical protein
VSQAKLPLVAVGCGFTLVLRKRRDAIFVPVPVPVPVTVAGFTCNAISTDIFFGSRWRIVSVPFTRIDSVCSTSHDARHWQHQNGKDE